MIPFFLVFCSKNFAQQGNDFSDVFWENGLRIESKSKQNKIKLGGRIHYDMGIYAIDKEAVKNGYSLKTKKGDEFRRVQMAVSGTIFGKIDFKGQLSFLDGEIKVLETFITFKEVPLVGNISFGNIVEPYRLESLTSSKYTTFMERALSNNFISGMENGVIFFDEFYNKRLAYQLGLFGLVNYDSSLFNSLNKNYAITGRLAGTLFNSDRILLHLGGTYSYRKVNKGKSFNYGIRPEVHLSEKYISNEYYEVEHVNLMNIETSMVTGAFSFQTEYTRATIISLLKNFKVEGFYTQVSYFLTGEKRVYESSLYGFGRVKPKRNLGKNGGGAIELALRYSTIEGKNNNKISNVTAGATWFLNASTKIMPNYIISDINNNTEFKGSGEFTGIQVRLEVDF